MTKTGKIINNFRRVKTLLHYANTISLQIRPVANFGKKINIKKLELYFVAKLLLYYKNKDKYKNKIKKMEKMMYATVHIINFEQVGKEFNLVIDYLVKKCIYYVDTLTRRSKKKITKFRVNRDRDYTFETKLQRKYHHVIKRYNIAYTSLEQDKEKALRDYLRYQVETGYIFVTDKYVYKGRIYHHK